MTKSMLRLFNGYLNALESNLGVGIDMSILILKLHCITNSFFPIFLAALKEQDVIELGGSVLLELLLMETF